MVFWIPRVMADVVRGSDMSAAVLPYLSRIGLHADAVQVTATDGGRVSPTLDAGRCVRLLGASSGMTVLYDPSSQVLVRVPTERLIIERPCR